MKQEKSIAIAKWLRIVVSPEVCLVPHIITTFSSLQTRFNFAITLDYNEAEFDLFFIELFTTDNFVPKRLTTLSSICLDNAIIRNIVLN